MVTHFIDVAYSPCDVPLAGLVPINLRELTLETHHRGRVLIVKSFCEPVKAAYIMSAVEDELGDVDRLAVHNLLPTAEANTVLPQGAIVAIKEPYYKFVTTQGVTMVYVDHPTDLVLLKPGNGIIPRGLDTRPMEMSRSALRLKEEGNAKFVNRNFQAAAEIYSDALGACGLSESDDALRRDLHRNRAAANLRLGRYDPVIKDALDSMVPAEDKSEAAKGANIKALHRAGKAAYAIQDFAQAKQHFGLALELDGSHKESRDEFSRTMKRISEQENGDYDFSMMSKSVTMQHYLLDHASFLRRVKVASTESRGRGLFTTAALKPGEVVFVEKAFQFSHANGKSSDLPVLLNLNTGRISSGTLSQRFYNLVNKVLWNPTFANQYNELFDGGKFGGETECKVVDGKVAVDIFRVQAIAELNGFECPRAKAIEKREVEAKDQESSGIWLQASYMNHSCLPNVHGVYMGDMMIVRAVRDIPAGGEIFTRYADPSLPFAQRQKQLKDKYRFECDCDLCRAEAKVPKAIVEKRARIRKEIGSFLAENNFANWSPLAKSPVKKARAKKLLKEIQGTYPKALFERLPRAECSEIGYWVATSVPSFTEDFLVKFLEVLRDFGFFVNIRGTKVTIERRAVIYHEFVIHAAMFAAKCLENSDDRNAVSALQSLAKDVFVSMAGDQEVFEREFGY